jgi:pimeloyl-ACP methyl ester carboxylesterase
MNKGYIQSGSANIYYELHGDSGEYLVLLHGNGESMQRMHHQIEYFSKSYRVLAIDSRGHGESTFGKGSLSLSSMALDVENVLIALNIDKVNLLGFSDGANIAMLLAIKRPELISKLVLIGGNTKPTGMTAGSLTAVYAAYFLTKASAFFDKTRKYQIDYLRLMAKEPHISPRNLKRITSPTLVVAGTHDMIKLSNTKLIVSSIPNSELCLLEGDHFIIYREPDVMNKAVDNFLNK